MSNAVDGINQENIIHTLKLFISRSVFLAKRSNHNFLYGYEYDEVEIYKSGVIRLKHGQYCINISIELDKDNNLSSFSIKFGKNEAYSIGGLFKWLFQINAFPDGRTSLYSTDFTRTVNGEYGVWSKRLAPHIREVGFQIICHPLFSNIYIFMKLLGIAELMRSRFNEKKWGYWEFVDMEDATVTMKVRKNYFSLRAYTILLTDLDSTDHLAYIGCGGEKIQVSSLGYFHNDLNYMLRGHIMKSMLTSLDTICNQLTLN
jgi:hypothetical protein